MSTTDRHPNGNPVCPGPKCPLCTGEACDLCGAGCWGRPQEPCEHDVLERHTYGGRSS